MISILYVNEVPAAATCTYSLSALTDNNDVTINKGDGNTTILAPADPI